jgi:hypothetical protein
LEIDSRTQEVRENWYLWAGGPSMMIFIHKICMAFKGFGNFITVESAINVNAAILL